MLRTNSRLLFLLLLILVFVAAPLSVLAAPNLSVTITHNGNADAGNVDFYTGSTTGKVTVAVHNNGSSSPADDTTGAFSVTVNLAGSLIATALDTGASAPGGLFTTANCSGLGTSTVTCSAPSGTLAASATETLIFSVTAPGTANAGPFTNSASVTGGGAPDANGSDAVSFKIVTPVVDMQVIGLTHAGNSGNNFIVNLNTGTVTAVVQNVGTVTSSGLITLNVILGDGLTFFAQSAGGLFTDCAGINQTVTCTTSATIAPGNGDTVTFKVTAPGSPNGGPFTNSSVISGGGDVTPFVKPDAVSFAIVLSGTNTPTLTPSVTPFPTFPIATFTAIPTLAPPTTIPTPTFIPNPPTSTPLPRPANAGQAVGPIPHAGVTVVVDRDGVNVRLFPAIGAEVIATVNAGFSTDIIARSPDNQWVQVLLDGQLGWIGTPVLAIVAGDLNSAPVADPRTIPYGGFENPRAGLTSVTSALTGKLQLSGLRVRGGPSRSYPVLANAPRYTIFSLLGRTADKLWLQVNFDGTLGWVATEFVELQQGLGVLDQLPIDGIVADALPVSEPTADSYTDTLKLMLSRVELAQPSLDAIRGIWTNIALGQRAACGAYPARPTNFNIPNPVLAPFYATLFPLNTDFNSAMTSLRQAIDLFIQICSSPQPAEGFVGQPVVQQALDDINQTDALFNSLRQQLNALLPATGPIDDTKECLFSFEGRQQVVPRLNINQAQLAHLTKHDFVLGFCFDGGAGQSLKIQALKYTGNAEPRLTVSAFDNPTNFLGTATISGQNTDVAIQPILIPQTGRYILILADLDGAPDGADLDGQIALLLTDVTASSGFGSPTLAIDPATGNLVITQGSQIPPATPGIGLTPGVNLTPGDLGSINLTPATRTSG